MNDQELLKQLNNLKAVIKPDNRWKESNREILLNQINSGQQNIEKIKLSWLNILEDMLPQRMLRPAWTVAVIIFAVLASGLAGVRAARDSKPGDSLYIAKIINEKAQLALTFNEMEKAKLGIEFAGNRAKEITQVMEESNNANEKEAQVGKLTENFKKEINAVKSRLEKINAVGGTDNKIAASDKVSQGEAVANQNNEESQVFGANLNKSDQGMKIAEKDCGDSANAGEPAGQIQSGVNASTTAAADIAAGKSAELEKALKEASELINKEDYAGTLNKLDDLNNIIGNSGAKQESGCAATSTEEKLDNGEVLGASEVQGDNNVSASSSVEK